MFPLMNPSNYSLHSGFSYGVKTLAFFDSFAGLVPVKVVSIPKGGPISGWLRQGEEQLKVKVTATRGAYKKGEELSVSPWLCIPRNHVRTIGAQYRIRTNFSWV